MPRRPPRFVLGDPAPAPRAPTWRGWTAVAVLSAVLLLQVVLADRARLGTDPAWRPRLEALCGWLRCTLPAWHEPAAFRVTSREVRPHPSAPGVLLVTTSFRNDARWEQAWPLLEVALHDLDGQALGLRRFEPVEYLGALPATPTLAPGQSAIATLEIVDPGKRAVAFTFNFY